MAGFSNQKFLAPSHFTEPDRNVVGKDAADSTKRVLLPPSTYENVQTNTGPGNHDGKKEIIPNTKRLVQFLNDELQKANWKISELEQEKTILQDNVQDRQALLQVVCQLKKDLKKSKNKLNEKEKNEERTEEYLNVIRCLRANLQEAENNYSSLKQNYSKLLEDIRLSHETNDYLKRKFEANDLEFGHVVHAKEQEICDAVMKVRELSIERDLKEKMLTQIKDKCRTLEESKKQADDERERVLKDKIKIEEEFNSLNEDKCKIERDLWRLEKDKQKILEDLDKMRSEMSRIEQKRMVMKDEICRMEREKARLEEEQRNIIKCSEKSEENLKNEIQLKELMVNELKDSVEAKQEEFRKFKVASEAKVEDLEKKWKLKISQWENEMHSKDQIFHKESQMYQGEVCS